MKTLRQSLLTLSFTALSFGAVACAPLPTADDATVGQASAALTVAEESGDVTADAAAGETDAVATLSADESAAVPSMPGDADGVCDLDGRRAQVVARYDANGDGHLDATEVAALRSDLSGTFLGRFGLAHRRPVMRRLHWVFDENGDGQLSHEERVAMVDALEARCQRVRAAVVARFDANGDGTLDATERQAAKDAFLARVQAMKQHVLDQYDVNHDGVLDETERQALRDDRLAAIRARRAALVAQFDTNGDGSLDDAEKLALKHALQQRIAEGRDAE